MVIDDRLLLLTLALRPPAELAGEPLVTTHTWRWRLARALAASDRGTAGTHSSFLEALPKGLARLALSSLKSLPATIATPDLRTQMPLMAELAARHRLNLLAAEAIATALVFGRPLRVVERNDGPRLRAAALAAGVDYATITT